ncbi:MAG: MFS transporter [Thalassobaculaceae bacterium]
MIASVSALLTSLALLLAGNGLLTLLLPTRAALDGMATGVIGLAMSGYFVGYVLGCLLTPRVVQRVGHIRSFAALAALAAATALAYALAGDPVAWFVLRAFSGAAMAGLTMIVESWLNDRATDETRGRIISIYRIVDLSAVSAGQLLLSVAPVAGFELFSLSAILIVLALVPTAVSTAQAPAPIQNVRIRLFYLWRVSPLGLAAALAVGVGNGAFWSLGAVFGQKTGLDTVGISLFMTAVVIGGAVMQVPIAALDRIFDRRKVLIGAAFATAIVSIAASFLAPLSVEWAIASGFVLGGLFLPIYGLALAHANDRLEAGDFVVMSAGLLLTFGLGAIVGPPIASFMMEAIGPRALFLHISAVWFALVLFGLWRLRVRPPVALEEQAELVVSPRGGTIMFELDPRTEDPPPTSASADGAEPPVR